MTTRVLLFDADGEDTELAPSGPLSRPSERQLLWVDLEGRGELSPAELLSGLGLLPATLEALQGQGPSRPRLVHHGKYVVLNINVAVGAAPFRRRRRARRGPAATGRAERAAAAPDAAQDFSPLLVVAAMLPFFLGLLVVGPWLGHASWHAYRGAVAPEPQPAPATAATDQG